MTSSVTRKHWVSLFDGDNEQEMFCRGLVNDRNMLSASALVNPDFHDLVLQAHEAFLAAGATYIRTCNYNVTPGAGFTDQEIQELTALAGKLAFQSREEANEKEKIKICGVLPPLMAMYRADRTTDEKMGKKYYKMIGESLNECVDMFVAESMSSLGEAIIAYDAVCELNKPILISFGLDSNANLRSGEDLIQSVKKLLAHAWGTERLEEPEEEAKPEEEIEGKSFEKSLEEEATVQKEEEQRQEEPTEAKLLQEFQEKVSTGKQEEDERKAGAVTEAFTNISQATKASTEKAPTTVSEQQEESKEHPQVVEESSSMSDTRPMLHGIIFGYSQPEDITRALRHLHEQKQLLFTLEKRNVRLGAMGNRISPFSSAGQLAERVAPGVNHANLDMEIYTEFAVQWANYGAEIIGGCYGIGPEYITRLYATLQTQEILEKYFGI